MGQLFQSGTDLELLSRLALMRRRLSCAMGLGPLPDGQGTTARRERVSTEARALCRNGALDGGCREQCPGTKNGAGKHGSAPARHPTEAKIHQVSRPQGHRTDAAALLSRLGVRQVCSQRG
jgi:hypothetical protein